MAMSALHRAESRRRRDQAQEGLKSKRNLCANVMNEMEGKYDRWLCQGLDRWADIGRAASALKASGSEKVFAEKVAERRQIAASFSGNRGLERRRCSPCHKT